MRDLFYDHELGGKEYATDTKIDRDFCPKFCMKNKKDGQHLKHLSFTWRPNDPKDPDAVIGSCTCVEIVHFVKLQFGSISAYLG
jgi:hypothetical protein